jgi:hypothetical protein
MEAKKRCHCYKPQIPIKYFSRADTRYQPTLPKWVPQLVHILVNVGEGMNENSLRIPVVIYKTKWRISFMSKD